jgi:hypothetical protein
MYCPCGNIVENKDTGLCASCGAEQRKAARASLKTKEKKPIRKVSEKREFELIDYNREAKKFLIGKNCVHFKKQKATEVHHMIGRIGYADDWARERHITLLMDKRFWLPVSHDAHELITNNTQWAIDAGYSFKRNGDEDKRGENKHGLNGFTSEVSAPTSTLLKKQLWKQD